MIRIRAVILLLATGFTPTLADETNCSDCLRDGLDAKQRGDMELALSLFERGCEQGSDKACDAAAQVLAREATFKWKAARGIAIGRRSCELGVWQGCGDIGAIVVYANNPEVAAEGRALLTRACDGDYAPACDKLGTSLRYGYGGTIDTAAARQAMARSCELGLASGCNNYALLLFAGGEADKARARLLVTQTCDAGDAGGCGILGLALRDGVGGPSDAAASNRNLERACDAGVVAFCSDLASAYLYGTGGVEVDVERAAALLRTACDGGTKRACEALEKIEQAAGRETSSGGPWSMSMKNVSFGTGNRSADENGVSPSNTIGSMQIGQGDETATFRDVRSSCGALQLTKAFGSAAATVRRCLGQSDQRRVTLAIEGGRVTSSSVDPDDDAGRCAANALAHARIEGLTCTFEASVSR